MSLFKEIMKWWETHHTIRKLVTGFVAVNIGFMITNWAIITENIPIEYQGIVALVFAILTAIHNYLKHNTSSIPGVSKKK